MTSDEGPWYKQFWLWFILTPLAILVTASFYLLYLAITTNDGVILDNYYKDGKGLVLRTEEDEFARMSHLSANLTIDNQKIAMKLTGDLVPMPENLQLILAHPTNQDFDVTIKLAHQGLGRFIGALPDQIEGRRILQLQPIEADQYWRLHFDGDISTATSNIELTPRQK